MRKIITSDTVHLHHPVEKVWSVISDFSSYKFWWPKFVNLRIIESDSSPLQTILRAKPFGGKSFSIKVDKVIPDEEIRLNYFEGIYSGFGRWLLMNKNGSTILTYEVNLEIVDLSIKLISYIVPVTVLHSIIFRKIFKNLERYLARG